ncbi:MAG: stage V sporulation protein D, partial [Magnetococcales bacterium]|nr:stage V sporulation protein D [Magnetococcales bacterium]
PVRVLKEDTSKKLRDMMVDVVSPEGTAKRASVEGYVVGGKTGTARKVSKQGGYAKGRYFASFVGFIPAHDPQLAIFIGVDEPEGKYYGGQVAAPIFKEIAEEVLPLLSILPERPKKSNLPPISGYVFDPDRLDDGPEGFYDLSLGESLQLLHSRGIVPLARGSGLIYQQDQTPGGRLRLYLK